MTPSHYLTLSLMAVFKKISAELWAVKQLLCFTMAMTDFKMSLNLLLFQATKEIPVEVTIVSALWHRTLLTLFMLLPPL